MKHIRDAYEQKMLAQLNELKAEIATFREKADQAETSLLLEYYTLIEEMQLKLETVEQKFELLKQVNDDRWEEFKTDLEQSWKSLREVIRAITSP